MFEPTRLATEHLADAYAQVVPLQHRVCRSSHGGAEGVPDSGGVAALGRERR
jgi:hypothetical protein